MIILNIYCIRSSFYRYQLKQSFTSFFPNASLFFFCQRSNSFVHRKQQTTANLWNKKHYNGKSIITGDSVSLKDVKWRDNYWYRRVPILASFTQVRLIATINIPLLVYAFPLVYKNDLLGSLLCALCNSPQKMYGYNVYIDIMQLFQTPVAQDYSTLQ